MLNPRSRSRGVAACGAALVLVVLAAGVQAQITKPTDPGVMSFPNVRVISSPPARGERADAAASDSGFLAFIDPQTGTLTQNPTPAQIEEIQALDKRSVTRKALAAAPARLVSPTGAIGARPDESYMSNVLVRRGLSGSVEIACVDGEEKSMSFLAGRSTPLPARGERREEVLQ